MNEAIDPVIDEVRKIREAYAEKFNYDIKAICRDLKRKQAKHADKVISKPFPRKKAETLL